MIAVISPAKTLDFESKPVTSQSTMPGFLDDSCELIEALKLLEPHDVSGLMSISPKLGELNANRFQTWQLPFTPENSFLPMPLAILQKDLEIDIDVLIRIRTARLPDSQDRHTTQPVDRPHGQDSSNAE